MLQRRNQTLIPGWLSLLLSVAFVLSSIVVMFFAYLTVQHVLSQPADATELAGDSATGDGLSPVGGGIALPPEISVTQTAVSIAPTPVPTTAAWEGDERVNILLMGIDRRPGEAFVSRTDSIMVVSVDPADESMAILSIPRDLYVLIPGYGEDRINTAFVYGSRTDAVADYVGGATLAMQTISYNLDIPIHHFVLVDFGAFTRTVDLLGGLDINVPYAIDDPLYPDMDYGYDPLYIDAGLHHFDGAAALKYARTRHADSDFNRAARQQQLLLAARQKAISLGVTDMLLKAPALYREIEQGVRTDLSLEQLIRLATTLSGMPGESIRNEVLDQNYVTSYRTPGGASVLLLTRETAIPMVRSLLGE